MSLYPAFLSLTGRRTVVVGASSDAIRRAKGLVKSGANVTLIDPHPPKSINGVQSIESRAAQESDLDGCWLVICASKDSALNQHMAGLCETRQIYCNIINQRDRCSFIVPALVDRSPLLIAITTGGVAPVLARTVKSKLESLIPAAYSKLADLVGRHQSSVQKKIPHRAQRADFWHKLINGPVAELAFHHDSKQLEPVLDELVQATTDASSTQTAGFVSLVGAGPGDPDLLTFRALRLIQSTDVLVYDRLVSTDILDLRRPDAELIYAGKAKADHAIPQPSINQLLVDLAIAGKNVVRLKGGDPFIFGRGGEEIETLVKHDIKFQVVPGITAASGCAAYAGIPLTHRDHAQSCVFVTGHLRNGEINLNWDDLKDPTQTIVVYMGLTGLSTICSKLIAQGRLHDTPAALVEQGTTPAQRVHTGTLESLPDLIAAREVQAPTLLIIGSVVSLREDLQWYESQDSRWS